MSDQADFLELRLDDLLVERLHDVLVGAGVQRARDVHHVVLGGAEHHLGDVAAGQAPQRFEELVAVHHRHVPIEQHGVGQLALAMRQRLLAVLGLGDLELQPLENATSDLPKVVFCTTENDVVHIARALHAGANEYIMKPFDKEIVEAKFQEVGLI